MTLSGLYPPTIYNIFFPGPNTSTSITLSTEISDGGSPITYRAIYYSTTSNPATSSDNIFLLPNTSGTVVSSVNGLTPSTGYYFSTYVANIIGGSSLFSFPYLTYTNP